MWKESQLTTSVNTSTWQLALSSDIIGRWERRWLVAGNWSFKYATYDNQAQLLDVRRVADFWLEPVRLAGPAMRWTKEAIRKSIRAARPSSPTRVIAVTAVIVLHCLVHKGSEAGLIKERLACTDALFYSVHVAPDSLAWWSHTRYIFLCVLVSTHTHKKN